MAVTEATLTLVTVLPICGVIFCALGIYCVFFDGYMRFFAKAEKDEDEHDPLEPKHLEAPVEIESIDLELKED